MPAYRLLLISETKPGLSANIHSSNQMIAWGLWSEFLKMPHVVLSHYPASPVNTSEEVWRASLAQIDNVDFTLIHSYTPGPIFTEIPLLRAKTKHQILWISEAPFRGMDHCFTFLPYHGCQQIPLPALRDVLDESLVGVEKLPGSILIDHAWGREGDHKFPGPTDPNLWCEKLYEWLLPLKESRVIAQLERPAHEKLAGITIPDWIRRIPGAFYPEYLRSSAPFENFIMSHPGSYEHSIVDMAARGIRVLVPYPTVLHKHRAGWVIVQGGCPFAPQDTVDRLKLSTFTTREDLLKTLNQPLDKAAACTAMPEITASIDLYCQEILNGRLR